MKNISMKKNINEQREGIWGKSLKSLKSLMQIFAESANSANSAKQIFATFATFAMQIFSNLVNLVKLVMQIFHKGSYSAVRVSSVQQPTNIQRISNLSLTMRPILPLLVTLVMVIFGGWNSMAWGATSSVNTANLWTTSTDDANDRVVWTAPNVTFKLHNNGDGGNIELYLNDHILIQKNKTYKLEWEVADGYTIQVQRVSVRARSTLKSYITVGSTTSGNIYGQSYTTVTSEALSLGNDGYVTIRPNQGADGRDDAIVHMDGITVTYTFAGLTYTVHFDGNGSTGGSTGDLTSSQSFSFDEAKNLTTNGFTRTNYKFLGWTTNSDGSGTFYKDGENVVNLSSTNGATVNLYAKWTNEQTVTFDGTANWDGEKNENKYAPESFDIARTNVTFHLTKEMKQYNTLKKYGTLDYRYDNHEYFFLKKESDTDVTSDLRWSVVDGYTIRVSKISLDAKGDGSSYLNVKKTDGSASGSTEMKLYEKDGSFGSPRSCSVDDTETDKNGNQKKLLFGNPSTALSNDKYFEFKFTRKYYEWQFKSITLTYTITPNEHTITLDDNGGRGGDGTHKVTFDAATGSLTNAPTLYGYNFTGYYTSGGTKIFNADKSVVSGVSTYTDGSGNWIKDDDVELSAHWMANGYTITLNNQGADTGKGGTAEIDVTFDANTNLTSSITKPTKTDHIFDGYYTGENGTGTKIIEADGSIIASAGDDTYTDSSKNWKYAGNITLYAKWTSKQTPRFTPDGFSSASTNAIHVGDILSLNVADVSDGLAGDFVATYDDTYFNVTREGNIISIEALNAGDGKTVVFTQTENSSIFGATETYTFNVSKVANTMTIKDDCEAYVKDEIGAVVSGINSDATITTESSDATVAYYDVKANKIHIPNSESKSFSTKNVTIIIRQAATYKYTAANETIVVTVKKYANAISCSWDEEPWSKSLNFDEETGVTFSSNNDTGTPIVVTPGSGVAAGNGTYDAINHKVIAGHNIGSATWTISQAEDYKYQAAEPKTVSVTVGTLPNPGCDVYSLACDKEASNVGTFSLTEVGAAGTLTFNMKYKGTSSGDEAKVSFHTQGGSWSSAQTVNATSWNYEDTKISINLSANIDQIKFENSGWDDPYINNIKISRKQWFEIENAEGTAIDDITIPSRTISGAATTATFYVDYSTCADEIKVASDNAHITADITSISSTTHGRQAITLTYNSDVAEDIAATVTIYTPYEHKTLTVNAETVSKLSTELRWKEGVSTTYSVDHANMAATDLFEVYDANGDLVENPVITLSSSATGVINTESDNTAIDFICSGSATITASYAGDATYAAASDLGQSITVNKVADEITWGAAVVNDTLRVYADQDIAYSLATAHTSATKPITYTSGDATILCVTPGESSDALHTLKYDTVSLTAETTADCFYSSVSSSIVVVVLPCKHRIVWNQTFGYHTESDGTISKSVTLNAYAVDSTGAQTNVAISYTMPSVSFARIDEGVLEIDGTGETTITARTETDNKYATAEVERSIVVRISGENVAYAYNNGDDVSDGKIVINGPHATFTIAGPTGIYYYTGGSCGDDGYFLASLDKNTNATYTLSWTCDESCTIEVTNISFWGKAYNWAAGRASKAKMIFNGKTTNVGTAALTCNSADYAKFSESGSFSSPMTIECQNTFDAPWYDAITPHDFDFYLKNIVIEYTITAKTPAGGSETALAATLSLDDKQTAALGSLFSMANPASDFEYEYQLKEAYTNAFIEGGNFYATYGGDYEVQSRVKPDDDHKASEWSTSTIHVTRTCIFNNNSTDKEWETVSNWLHNVRPAAIDAVRVQDNLIVDEEIEVMSMSIEGEAVVHIAPEGGLTVGAGGITGATKDNLKLKAGTTDETKGQTGYLRISPEYTGAMPEATVEMLRQAYSNGTVTTGSFSMTGTSTWQYVGCPVEKEGTLLKKIIGGWINSWDEESGAWINNRATLETKPFVGVANSQSINPLGAINAFKGQLINVKTEHEIPLTYHGDSPMAGWNLLANSFAAPIDIKKMLDDNSEAIEQAVYLFNTGNTSNVSGESGTYTVVTKALAGTTDADVEYQGVIPAMQGFFVKANSNCNFTFNYTNAVWNATYASGSENTPMRVNRRNDSSDKQVLSISMEANGQRDKVLLIEKEDYSTEFENGYDAHYMPVGGFNIFAVEGEDHLAVDATNSIIGTRVGVRTGEETAYTLVFSHVNSEEEMMLWDTEAEEKVEIREGGMYTFFAEPNSEITGRFIIIEAEDPEIATGVEDVQGDAKVHKFIKDDKLFILKNGVLYDATGARVR